MINPLSRDLREAAGKGAWAVPAAGLIGPDAIREAFEGDLRQLQDLLQGSIKTALELTGEDDWWPYVHGLFDDFIVVEAKDGRLLRYPYSADGTKVALGTPIEVTKTFVPVDENKSVSNPISEAKAGDFLETTGSGQFRIRAIRGGVSANRNYYPASVLRAAVNLFEGVRVFVKSDAEHLAGQGKDVRNLIGVLQNAAFIAESSGEIHADLRLLEPEGAIATKLHEAWSQNLTSLFGFSIDARAEVRLAKVDGHTVREAVKFETVNSVDLIVEPGAGGEILHMLEAAGQDNGDPLMERSEIIALLEANGLLKDKNVEEMSDEELKALLAASVREAAPAADPTPAETETSDAPLTRGDLQLFEARMYAAETIAICTLPTPAKAKLSKHFKEAKGFTAADVDQAITDEREYLATFTESGRVVDLGETPVIQAGDTSFERVGQMFDAFFDQNDPNHRQAQSFRECYLVATGDTNFTGRAQRGSPIMREALDSGTFADVLGDSMTRRMIADYNLPSPYDSWRKVVHVTRFSDFREQKRTRWGGYGDLPVVAQRTDYPALASPSDEAAAYTPAKRGGIESVTWEMTLNDDADVIRQIPIKLSRASKRTLAKFVFDFILTNPVIYDGLALFHASHGNLGSALLGKAGLADGRLAMLHQTEKDTGERLLIPARNLLVPTTLEETAADLFRRNTENDKTFIQDLSLDIIPVWYWTDANDWALTADPNEAPGIELAFLNGQEEPELYTQDMPNTGSVFKNDTIEIKVRQIYGGVPVDYRAFYKSVNL